MNTSIDIIAALFGGPGRTAILRLLAAQTAPLTGRQIADLAGLSPAGAARALDHLGGLGVVSRRRVGRATTHELDRENLIVRTIVLPTFDAERNLLGSMIVDLAQTFGPLSVSVVLFGSVGRGEAEPGSDVDVLVVTSDQASATTAMNAADSAGYAFFRRYGMPLSVIVTAADALPAQPSGFLASARDEGVLVAGRPLGELMDHAAE